MGRNPWKITSLLLAILLAFSIAANFSSPAAAERQPLMRKALHHVNVAIGLLQKATWDKGGHRVKAIGLLEKGRNQIQKGIKFDNRH